MYEIIENRQRMTNAEIRQKYDGKWVYLVDLVGKLGSPYETAVPVLVADTPWAGDETGIYEDFMENHDRVMHKSFLKNEWNVFGFNEVAHDE